MSYGRTKLLCPMLLLSLACEVSAQTAAPAPVDVSPYVRRDTYGDVEISPKGDYLAVTVPTEDRTVLVVLRRADMTPTAKIQGGKDSLIYDFGWANDERLVASMAVKVGVDDKPYANGEIYAVNADGTRATSLTGTAEFTFAEVHDLLRDDDRSILIGAIPFGESNKTLLQKLDVYTGQRSPVAASPVPRASFVTDHEGNARFAFGAGNDNAGKLYYREKDSTDWRLIADETRTGLVETPIGFAADGKHAYLRTERPGKPDAILSWDPATDQRTEVMSDPVVDPYSILVDRDGTPIGARFMHDGVHSRFFDPNAPGAKLYRQLEKAFPDAAVLITSATADGKLLVVQVLSDRNPGDYYIFDTVAKHVLPLFARRLWLDPEKMAPTASVDFEARDGVALHGYLTLPPGKQRGTPLPMVLLPHGGPFDVFDRWWFDDEAQLLAEAGYAVLRVNYRGSSNYGRDFLESGARQWGRKLQFDLTDATRWAIAQKIADPKRICIYGASYGAYAALMGAATEPDLYRCAAGYVGVYDMVEHHKKVSGSSRANRNWVDDWYGPRENMAAISVLDKAAQIKVPVFLAAGGKDEIAPIEHSEKMEKALKNAGVQVETLYFPYEGHGFYKEEHRIAFYTRLLNFLSGQIGGAAAK